MPKPHPLPNEPTVLSSLTLFFQDFEMLDTPTCHVIPTPSASFPGVNPIKANFALKELKILLILDSYFLRLKLLSQLLLKPCNVQPIETNLYFLKTTKIS